jgi:hypothetical protein
MQSSSTNVSLRRQRSLSEARDLVAAWRASGASKAAWCRSQGIEKWTLKSSLARVQRAESGPSRSRSGLALPGFIAVNPPVEMEVVPVREVRIELGGGAQICGLDVDGVIAVLRGLREVSR